MTPLFHRTRAEPNTFDATSVCRRSLRKLTAVTAAVFAVGMTLCLASLCYSAAPQATQPNPDKVLRIAFEAPDSGLDMVHANNSLYSMTVGEAIFETLVHFDYFSDTPVLVPGVAVAMPEISSDQLTYTFRLQPHILFSPDPFFSGRPRELTAEDYIYTLKRVMNPANHSAAATSFEGKIAGMDTAIAAVRKGGRFDYNKPIEGLRALDRYTLQVKLVRPDPTFLYQLTSPAAGAVAREVIDHYGNTIGEHPVGTGPYQLLDYSPANKIVLVSNPNYRGFTWRANTEGTRADAITTGKMQGKQMPRIGRIDISIIEEAQSMWLSFSSGRLDMINVPLSATSKALDDHNRLQPTLATQGIQLYRQLTPAISYTLFNMRDPVVGGESMEKIALRRAIAMGYNLNDDIRIVRQNQALRAESIVPPGVAGYDARYRTSIVYDPILANRLLDRFHYKKGEDGYRLTPQGKPLTLSISSMPDSQSQTMMEIWKRSMDAIGIRTTFPVSSFSENLKSATACKLMMWGLGASAGIPDGSDFFSGYFSQYIGAGNLSCYSSPAFDALYQKSILLPDNPERQALYEKMNRQLEADTPLVLHTTRYRNTLVRSKILGYRSTPLSFNNWAYLDLSD